MKEIYRAKKVYDGVTHAAKLYPNAYVIMIIIGTMKGNGAGFVKLLERLIRGAWTPTAMEFMQPTLLVLYNKIICNNILPDNLQCVALIIVC